MGKIAIEWTDAVWNPVTGCTKVSGGCKHCYAERIWARLSAPGTYAGRKFTDVACHLEGLGQPLRWRLPRRVFVNSMSELFHEDVPFEFSCKVIATCIDALQHSFQILAKRPERMLEWSRRHERERHSWPASNVCLGVSVEDQAMADERIPLLLLTPAAMHFASAEPLLGPVNLTDLMQPSGDHINAFYGWHNAGTIRHVRGIDWLIVGGESGPESRPLHPDWARSLRGQCETAGVAYFMTQMTKKAAIPADLMIREFPHANP